MDQIINLLEDSINQTPIGKTQNFVWIATPIGIAALYKAKTSNSPPPFQQAIKEGIEMALDLTREEKEVYQTSKGMALLFYS